MPTFPRTIKPAEPGLFEVPTGLVQRAQSGGQKLRSISQAGRFWQESFPPMKSGEPDVEALIATIEYFWHQQIIFEIEHLATPGSGLDPNGLGTAGVTISGADQTGDSIVTTGWPASTSNVARAGDVIRIAGLNLLYKIREDANSDGAGDATLKINPPIFAGNAPTDGAAVTTTGCTVRARIASKPNVPRGRRGGGILVGLQLSFREMP